MSQRQRKNAFVTPIWTVEEIVAYWAPRESECGLGVDWTEAHERCWRCGTKTRLQRCHIVAASLGGANEPSNLVLLCKWCHEEAPNIDDPKYMWIWLRKTSVPIYDTYRFEKGMMEFEKLFGRKPHFRSGVDDPASYLAEFQSALKEHMGAVTVHFGHGGRLNPATIACLIHKIEQIAGGCPIPAPAA